MVGGRSGGGERPRGREGGRVRGGGRSPRDVQADRELIVPGADSLKTRLRIRKGRSSRKLHVRFLMKHEPCYKNKKNKKSITSLCKRGRGEGEGG